MSFRANSASLAQALASNSQFALTTDRLEEMDRVIELRILDRGPETFVPSLERRAHEPKELPPLAPDTIIAFLDSLSTELRDVRVEIRTRASRAFAASLTLGITGAIALLVGIGLMLSGTRNAGVLSSIGAAVTGLFSGIFAKLYLTENADLRSVLNDLSLIERVRVRLHVASQIKDAKRRDEAIAAIGSELQGTRQAHGRRAAAK